MICLCSKLVGLVIYRDRVVETKYWVVLHGLVEVGIYWHRWEVVRGRVEVEGKLL